MSDISLPPCLRVDSTNCFWDANVQGNGEGHSFLNHDGYTVYIEVPPGMYISEALVTPAADRYAAVPNFSWSFGESTVAETPQEAPGGPQLPATGVDPTLAILIGLSLAVAGIAAIVVSLVKKG